jgi:hypothetical protein
LAYYGIYGQPIILYVYTGGAMTSDDVLRAAFERLHSSKAARKYMREQINGRKVQDISYDEMLRIIEQAIRVKDNER